MNRKPVDVTVDYFFKKKVIVLQQKKGYRFSIDSPILAHFLPSPRKAEALEIGTGCGIVSILALYKKKFSHITGLEIQEDLCRLSEINTRKNQFSKSYTALNGDFNHFYQDFRGIKWIFSNPPFMKLNQGRLSTNDAIRIAKFEVNLTVQSLLEKSYSILDPEGQMCLILPYSRLKELLNMAIEIGFSLKRIQMVFSFKHGKPERFLIQLSKYKVSTDKINPLIIFKEKGIYTKEMEMILTG